MIDENLESYALGQIIGFADGLSLYQAEGFDGDLLDGTSARNVWTSVSALAEQGQELSLRVVLSDVQARGVSVERTWLMGLVDGVPAPTSASARDVVGRLGRLKMVRDAKRKAQSLLRTLNATAVPESDELQSLVTDIDTALSAGARVSWQDTDSQADAAREMASRVATSGGIPLGLARIDDVLDEIVGGQMLAIMARPGVGKTVMLVNLMRTWLDAGYQVAMFSLEMPTAKIIMRLQMCQWSQTREGIREYAVPRDEHRQMCERLLVDDTASLSVAQMALRARQVRVERQPLIIVVDHAGLIGGHESLKQYDRVSLQMRALQAMAKRLNAFVVVAVQVSREVGGDGSRRLHVGGGRDSGVVEEVFDYMIGMRRLDYDTDADDATRQQYRDQLFVEILKNRHGDRMSREQVFTMDQTLRLTFAPGIQAPRKRARMGEK